MLGGRDAPRPIVTRSGENTLPPRKLLVYSGSLTRATRGPIRKSKTRLIDGPWPNVPDRLHDSIRETLEGDLE